VGILSLVKLSGASIVSNQQGQGGKDNTNVGGDYIQGDKAGRDIDKSRKIRISLSFLAIAAFAVGGGFVAAPIQIS
jgi:hypothetical protein